MFDKKTHPNTQTMLDAWRRMATSPSEMATGPQANQYPELLTRLFVLQRTQAGHWDFRSCGEDLPGLLGRDLAEYSFTNLWTKADKAMIAATLDAIFDGDAPGLLRARGETITGKQVLLEIPLAPISTPKGRTARILGLYQTLGGEPMLGGRAIRKHTLTALFPPNIRTEDTHIRLVASND
ncbi:MAG: PAS domain-containing protein [Hyphomonadaceae bacterium]